MNVVMNRGNVVCVKDFLCLDDVQCITDLCNTIPTMGAFTGRPLSGIEDPDEIPSQEKDGIQDPEIRKSEVKWVDTEKLPEQLIEKIIQNIRFLTQSEMNCNLDFYLTEQWQHTTYNGCADSGDHYTWHQDDQLFPETTHTLPDGTPFIRKMSASIILSDSEDYEGGDFQFIDWQKSLDYIPSDGNVNLNNFIWTVPESCKTKGSLVLFPSITHHRVKPVIWGTRSSLVMWFGGAPYV